MANDIIGIGGTVVHILVNTDQLRLIERACDFTVEHSDERFTSAEIEELEVLRDMADASASDPGEPGTVHGFVV